MLLWVFMKLGVETWGGGGGGGGRGFRVSG